MTIEYKWGYDITHTCEYDEDSGGHRCGNPAPYRMWWAASYNAAYFCEHHFKIHKARAEKLEAAAKGEIE